MSYAVISKMQKKIHNRDKQDSKRLIVGIEFPKTPFTPKKQK